MRRYQIIGRTSVLAIISIKTMDIPFTRYPDGNTGEMLYLQCPDDIEKVELMNFCLHGGDTRLVGSFHNTPPWEGYCLCTNLPRWYCTYPQYVIRIKWNCFKLLHLPASWCVFNLISNARLDTSQRPTLPSSYTIRARMFSVSLHLNNLACIIIPFKRRELSSEVGRGWISINWHPIEIRPNKQRGKIQC